MKEPTRDLLRSDRDLRTAVWEAGPTLRATAATSFAEGVTPPFSDVGGLRQDGYAIVPGTIDDCGADDLRTSVTRLCDAGWPGVFVFLFDDAWNAGRMLERAVTNALGVPYELLADAWAWSIAPGRRGWKPHRGGGPVLFDREAPELITAWLALSDATAERACMYLVPFGEDPSYPSHLDRVDAPLAGVRAVPVPAGSAVLWNANVLHWGGACSPRALGPRVSCSFSLGRVDAREAHRIAAVPPTMDATARLDLIAAQIAMYSAQEEDLSPDVLDWAQANLRLRQGAEHFQLLSRARKAT